MSEGLKTLWEKAKKSGKAQRLGSEEKKEFVEEFHNYSHQGIKKIRADRMKHIIPLFLLLLAPATTA